MPERECLITKEIQDEVDRIGKKYEVEGLDFVCPFCVLTGVHEKDCVHPESDRRHLNDSDLCCPHCQMSFEGHDEE